MEIIHWDDVPFGTGFAVSQFSEGPHKGMWGISANLPDNRLVWVALGSPPELVFALNKAMCQSILANLRTFSKMKKVAEEMGSWGNENSSGLPDPRTFPVVQWDEVPESARLQEREFRSNIWGIVARLSDGEHLVMFDRFAQDAGYHTFSATQEDARHTVAYLEMLQTPPDPQPNVEERLRSVASGHQDEPPAFSDFDEREHFADILVAINEYAEKDRKQIASLDKEWRRRLEAGNRESCLCGQCRHEIRYKVTKILDWYEESMGYVPEELRLDSLRLLDLLKP